MAKQLRGVMAALLTPFNSQQALDKESLRRLVQFNIQQGIDGLYVGGSTGEAFVQSLAEREQVDAAAALGGRAAPRRVDRRRLPLELREQPSRALGVARARERLDGGLVLRRMADEHVHVGFSGNRDPRNQG